MTIGFTEILLYMGALFLLWATPGPVWVAMIARAVSTGFRGAWPLAFGVALGDIIWPLVAIFGLSVLVSVYADVMTFLRYFAAVLLALMGAALIRWPDKVFKDDGAMTRPGMWAGFIAGLTAVVANPKAVLFYLTLLPSFFEFEGIRAIDVAIICFASAIVPFVGNLVLALFVDAMRRFLSSPKAVRWTNITAGIALIGVAIFIAIKA
ncbi:MAG: LysE family translocator [Pseudomonadota bacterium]